MKANEILNEIANANGFDYVEVTEGMNGYPKNLRGAITGFTTYAEARKIADQIEDADVVLLHQKDGWQLWEDKGWMMEDIDVQAMYEKEGFLTADNTLTLDHYFYLRNVWDIVEDMEDATDIKEFLNEVHESFNKIKKINDGCFVALHETYHNVEYYGKKMNTEYSYDTHNYKIGVIVGQTTL